MRKLIFDAIKKERGKGFTNDEVIEIDALLDQLGIARDDAPVRDPFVIALNEVLSHEGGFVNDPRDPGGMTNLGVTKHTWEAWVGHPVDEATMRALTRAKVKPLYRKNYWDVLHCDEIHPALALCVFDFGVNAGPTRSARYLQKLVGVVTDGIVGPDTLAATKRKVSQIGPAQAVRTYQQMRRDYYKSRGTFNTFGRGWLRRVDAVEDAALRLI